ncbi:unnamed protein product, partial [Brassica napus]
HIFYLLQTRVINFVQKDIGEMCPKWEFDVEDTPAENIIKLMFVKKPWKWTMDCWEVTGTWVNTKPAVEDSPRPRKKARKEASEETSEEAAAVASEEAAAEAKEIKTMFKGIVDAMREGFGTCLKVIKYLWERLEVVEKKVGITTKRKGTSAQNTTPPPKSTLETGLHLLCFLYVRTRSEIMNGTNAGRKRLPEDKGPDVPADASSSKDKAPEPSLEDARYLEKRDAALALCRAKTNNMAKAIIPNKKLYPGYNPFAPIDKKKLKELADWLKTFIIEHLSIKNHVQVELGDDLPISRLHIDDWINVLRKRFNYKDFKDSEPDQNGLGRRLLVGRGIIMQNDTHWIAMWISIPKRHIVVWDRICSSISPEELDVVMKPFLYMVPYLLVECASSDEQRAQYTLEPFTYERPTNIPSARTGDCGVYTLNKKNFAKPNGKTMRDKMAVDIFQELPDAHEFENKDNDANLGAYEG